MKTSNITKQQINKQYEKLEKLTKKELIQILIETDKQIEYLRTQ